MRVVFGQMVPGRHWVLFIVPLLALLLGAGITKLEFSNDYRIWFGQDNPQLQAFNLNF